MGHQPATVPLRLLRGHGRMMNSTGGFCLLALAGMAVGVLSGSKQALGFVGAVRINRNLWESVSVEERLSLRDEVLLAFQHAYESYKTHACESVSCANVTMQRVLPLSVLTDFFVSLFPTITAFLSTIIQIIELTVR